MIIRDHQKKTMKPPYKLAGILELSGTTTVVGSLQESDPAGDAVFIQPDENPEPIFMSAAEARMLIAALQVSISELEGE